MQRFPDQDTLVVAISAAPKTLDPRFTTDAVGQRLVGLLFNSLVRIGSDLTIVGDAADHWDYKDKVYTFHLKPGLKFSNGRALTEDDLRFSFDFYRGSRSPFQSTFSLIESVEIQSAQGAPSQVKLKLKLKEFSAALLTDLSNLRFLPRHELEADPDAFVASPMGTGGFAIDKIEVNQIHLKAQADHPYQAPLMKHVVFKIIQDDGTRYLKMRKGGIDLVQADMPLNKVKDFEKLPEFHIFKTPGLATDYVLFNFQDANLKSRVTRDAFASSVDRAEVIRYKLNGLATPASTILSDGNPFLAPHLPLPALDLKKAKEEVRNEHLENIEFILKTSNNPEAFEKARVLAHQFEQAGLKIKLQSYEWGTFYSDISKGNFQVAIMRWTGVTDPDIFRLAFHSREIPADGHGRNRGSYKNTTLDPLLDQGLQEFDIQKRKNIYSKIETIIANEIPIIPLWHEDQVAIVHARVLHYVPTLNGDYTPIF